MMQSNFCTYRPIDDTSDFERVNSENQLANSDTPTCQTSLVYFDALKEGESCEFCGRPVTFLDDDWMVCPNCSAEYSNMDDVGDGLGPDSAPY